MKNEISKKLFHQAKKIIPGGVNSPVRAFKSVGGIPFFVDYANGSHLIDVDGQSYIDYVNSWGASILGHAHPVIIEAVKKAAERGLSFGTSHETEIKLAEKICSLMPAIEMVRMVNSGTEATMTAIRVARGFTGKNKIIKFNGCYHGHSDSLLAKSGSGALTLGIPDSLGVPQAFTNETLIAHYNDLESVKMLFEKYEQDIAGIIVEPIAGNMNCILPREGFLKGLREICDQYKALLIFDEVMTGFRVALGGAQSLYSITPDLTTLGKIMGGGLPAAALGGKKEVMQVLSPQGGVYQAGTLSGNPLAMAAGLAAMDFLEKHPESYDVLNQKTEKLLLSFNQMAEKNKVPFFSQSVGGMFGLFFTDKKPVVVFEEAANSNVHLFNLFFHQMLEKGIYFAPSAFEAGFITLSHTNEDIEKTLIAAETVFHFLGKHRG